MQGTTEDRWTFTLGDRTFVLDAGTAEAALAAKRVVGGRVTHAFNLLPLRYGWAYELYRAMKANHWEPEDVPMQRDAEQWRAHDELSDVERWIVRMGIGYFSAAERIVGDNIIHVVRELVTASEWYGQRMTFPHDPRSSSSMRAPPWRHTLAKPTAAPSPRRTTITLSPATFAVMNEPGREISSARPTSIQRRAKMADCSAANRPGSV